MKQFWSYKDVFVWMMLWVAAVLVPRMALSAEPCESTASASLRKKSVDLEMAVISGDMSDLEVAGKKESLLRQVKREKDSCRALASRAPTARAQTSSF